MARVVLVDPRGWQGAVQGYPPSPNLGIAYLIPSLWKYSHDVLVIDLNNEGMDDREFIGRIEDFHPDLVGFSTKTSTVRSAESRGPSQPGIGGPSAGWPRGEMGQRPRKSSANFSEGCR